MNLRSVAVTIVFALAFPLAVVAITIGVALAGFIAAQETPPKKAGHRALLFLLDRSEVYASILHSEIKVRTDFGELNVPFEKITRIDFGLHYPPGAEKKITESIPLLAHQIYHKREQARAYLLTAGHFSYPILAARNETETDPEAKRRSAEILKVLKGKFSQEFLNIEEDDVVYTQKFKIVGRVMGEELKVTSLLGDKALHFSEIKRIYCGTHTDGKEVYVKGSGVTADKWVDTKLNINSKIRLNIRASGRVDIWPPVPGTYVTTPKGYTSLGSGSTFMAGALVGKIGVSGTSFLIGEQYDGSPTEEGTLYLQVIASPWNVASAGEYRVLITTGFDSPR